MLDACLHAAGIQHSAVRFVNRVPVRPPEDTFALHDPADKAWGDLLLQAELDRAVRAGARLIMPLGEAALAHVAPELPKPPRWSHDETTESKGGKIGAWRGSLFPLAVPPTNVASYIESLKPHAGPFVLPSYHPAAVATQFTWHAWSVLDFTRAKAFLDGRWQRPPVRQWYFDDLRAFERQVEDAIREGCFAIDTEMSPYAIVAVVTRGTVCAFGWNERFRPALQRLMSSSATKIAHNLGHDLTYLREALGITAVPPVLDSGGLAHILDSSLARNLSPALSTRFTSWPYHKWLVLENPKFYCGVDTCVAYDGADAALREIKTRPGLLDVAKHDHTLLWHLLEMQWKGVRIDDVARRRAVEELTAEYTASKAEWAKVAEPIVRAKLDKFEKPHLFYVRKQCECCNGATKCWRCSGFTAQPKKKADFETFMYRGGTVPVGKWTVAQAKAEMSGCGKCEPDGKISEWLPIEPDSKDQKADILYRGLGIYARKWKGKETTRIDQLEPLAEQHPEVRVLIHTQQVGTDLETMERLEPDLDQNIHSVFDPWGTVGGRTRSHEGLVQKGSNLQNIPKSKRYVIVPEPGHLFIAPDMAQIEGRAVAVSSGDENFLRIYREPLNWPGHAKHGKVDSHSYVQKLFHDNGVEVTRDQCKRLTYAAMYGGSAEQIALEINAEAARRGGGLVTAMQVAKILETFFRVFPGVRRWQERQVKSVLQTRSLTSITGRRFTWTGYITKQENHVTVLDPKIAKEAWSREPQDMAARVLALGLDAMRRMAHKLLDPRIHVHDELVIQIPATPGRMVDEACETAERLLTQTVWGMLFPADVGEPAPNWQCAKEAHVPTRPFLPEPGVNAVCKHCAKVLDVKYAYAA